MMFAYDMTYQSDLQRKKKKSAEKRKRTTDFQPGDYELMFTL